MSEEKDTDMIFRSAWQSGQSRAGDISPDSLRREAAKFGRRVKWRNALEYVAGVIVCIVFIAQIVHFQSAWLKIGAALGLLGTAFVLTNLHYRAGARTVDPARDCRSYYVGELARQRDALRSVWRWYLLPFLPGFLVFRIGVHLAVPPDQQLLHAMYDVAAIALAFGIDWINRRAASRLQDRIDEAQGLMEE